MMHTKDTILKESKIFKTLFDYLEESEKGLSNVYIQCLNTETKGHMKEFLSILDVYKENRGISKGYRTIAWDTAWGYYDEYIKGDSELEFFDYVDKNYKNDNNEFDDYDVAAQDENEYMYGLSMLFSEESKDIRTALARGSFSLLKEWGKFLFSFKKDK